ncbi:Thiol peroxidase [Planctomycetales bacterium 10988]|nr:Thiol peroxidase [Planctomycetales bacterium 10988]
MSRSGAVTFKGTPLTLVGDALEVGDSAPDFTLHRFADGGMQTVTLEDLLGKVSIISVVPSLDTSTCALQTKTFNEKLASFGGKLNALTVSCDLPFAQNRFCGAENIENMVWASDYQTRDFGKDYGMLIKELKLLARGIFILDAEGKILYTQVVPEVANEPDYDAALKVLEENL